MSATNTFEQNILKLILQNVDITDLARGAASAGNLYVSLHSADPGETGTQQTSEANYTSYGRVAVNRDTTDWSVSANGVNKVAITFPQATGGTTTATHFGIGTTSVGAGVLILSGTLSATLAVSNGITPSFAINQLIVTAD